MTNWNLTNAQNGLRTRQRPHATSRPIADLIPGARTAVATPNEWNAQPAAVHHYRCTPLDQFSFDHLQTAVTIKVGDSSVTYSPQEQRAILTDALARARLWLDTYTSAPGLGFLLCGPVGTGKTTIAENLMRPFREVLTPVDADGRPDPDLAPVEVLNGRLIDAGDLLRLMGDEDLDLGRALGNARIIVVDDAGYEEIGWSNERTETIKRQKRYGRFFDHCYRHGIHVIVTTMTPLWQGDQIHPEILDIFGPKAFSRLYAMTGEEFMIDLTGLPDYRPVLARGGAA